MATKLFIGNLSWDTTDESLSAFFSQAGTVVSATVIREKFSGRSKGFGFVEMSSEEEAEKAKAELNGKDLDGRPVNVADARPQEPRDDMDQSTDTEAPAAPVEEVAGDEVEEEPAESEE